MTDIQTEGIELASTTQLINRITNKITEGILPPTLANWRQLKTLVNTAEMQTERIQQVIREQIEKIEGKI